MDKDPNDGRVLKFVTKRGKGVRVFRLHDTKEGKRVYRDYFTFAIKRQGKRHYFTLSSERSTAEKEANEIAAFLNVRTNSIEDAIRKFCPQKAPDISPETKSPTVGELISKFEELGNHIAQSTKKQYVGALRRIVGHILGLPACHSSTRRSAMKAWRDRVDAFDVAAITPERLESFRGALIKAAGSDEVQKGKAVVTANSYIRNAGSMFSPRMIRLYTSFTLVSPCPFTVVGQIEERPHRYHSGFDVGEVVKAAKTELAGVRRDEFVVFVLALFAGLRRKEIDRLIWEQIDFEGGHIWIRTTPYYRPKARNSESRVDCSSEVFEILKDYKKYSSTPPFVIPGGTPDLKIRCRKIFKNLSEWLHSKGVTDVKALHTLRKEAGSHIFSATGSADQAAEFLRNHARTAREYYIGRQGRLEVSIPDA